MSKKFTFHRKAESRFHNTVERTKKGLDIVCLTAILCLAFAALILQTPYKSTAEAEPPEVVWVDDEAENPMLDALVKTESNGDENALSSKGAAGMYQIMPETARKPGYGVTPLRWWDGKDPRTAPLHEQKRFANDLLNAYQAHHDNNPVLAAASYNAGAGAVSRKLKQSKGDVHKAIGMLPTETRNYVVKVANYTPPRSSIFDVYDRAGR